MGLFSRITESNWFNHPLLKKYTALVHEDLSATYTRDIQKWLVVAPMIGIITGLLTTVITLLILTTIWGWMLPYYLHHHWAIVPGLVVGFFLTGLIMQFRTPDPDEHSTEEIIKSYHDHQGYVNTRPFFWKLLAATTTVGSGGSAALEGPSIYGGGAIGSWLWGRLQPHFRLETRDRRLMLISGAAAGMAAVFRAPLTGLIFALEMPYKDDMAHEALLPSFIASVIAYATLASIVGSQPLFGFVGSATFRPIDLAWSAVLGLGTGVVAMIFANGFRRFRVFSVNARIPHTAKLVIGGILTAACGLAFISIYPGDLIPIGPNYEAARHILTRSYPSGEMVVFAVLKLFATMFSLGTGGVSAMFVPLFLAGGGLGSAFAHSVVHSPTFDLYAAVGMASFIAAGYKTPLAAVIFVAETTGGHFYLIPTLIGAACAYAISGEASVSGDQHLSQTIEVRKLSRVTVEAVMQRKVDSIDADANLRSFADKITAHHQHAVFPVYDNGKPSGIISVWTLAGVPPEKWDTTRVREVADHNVHRVSINCDLNEARRLLTREGAHQVLMVVGNGELKGIVTETDILRAVNSLNAGEIQPAGNVADYKDTAMS
ncbi:MAG: chloride channel protein [Candidatus Binataceae bacterium]